MLTAQVSEPIWINSASRGDLESFNQLVLAYQDMAYRHARSLLGDPDTAEDVAQESFIRAFENIRSFRGRSFQAWLLTIVTNTARDRWRRRLRHPIVTLFPADEYGNEIEFSALLADPSASVETTVQRTEESAWLHRLLDELPAVYRSVLTLVDVYEMDYAEAADILGVPLGTVKSRLARARMRMRNKLLSALPIALPLAALSPCR
jgi:RNA polymerase sigma-70 factor (ECF subfamily)